MFNLPPGSMIDYPKYFPADLGSSKNNVRLVARLNANKTYAEPEIIFPETTVSPHFKQKRKVKKKGFQRITRSALGQQTHRQLERKTKKLVAAAKKDFKAQLIKEAAVKEKRRLEKVKRIKKEKNDTAAFRQQEDRSRKKALYRRNARRVAVLEPPVSSIMARILNTQPSTTRRDVAISTTSSTTSTSSTTTTTTTTSTYEYTKDRMKIAVQKLSNVLRTIKENDATRQDQLLEAIKRIMSKQAIPLNGTIVMFCRAFSNVHRFDPYAITSKFPHVFLNLFSSRKAKERLLTHLIRTFGAESEKEVLLEGHEEQSVKKYVRDVVCSLLRLQCLNVSALLNLQNSNNENYIKGGRSKGGGGGTTNGRRNAVEEKKIQQRAKERLQLFFEWYDHHKGDGPRKLREEAAIEIIQSRMSTHYIKFETLQTKEQRKLYKEINKLAISGEETRQLEKRKEVCARIFVGAWCGCHINAVAVAADADADADAADAAAAAAAAGAVKREDSKYFKKCIHRYDSLFCSIFQHHPRLERMLLTSMLVSFSSIPGDGSMDDPLVGCLKGLYNIFVLNGATLLEWHRQKTGTWRSINALLTMEEEKIMKERTKLLGNFFIQEETTHQKITREESEQMILEEDDENDETMEKMEKMGKTGKEEKQTKTIVRSTMERLPTACKRAPGEVAREQRGGRKVWASSLVHRPETPLFANWSPLEGAALTDRSKPSYPKSTTIVVHDHAPPKSTAHHGMSAKQQMLVGHYHDGSGESGQPKPLKPKESKQRQRFSAHRKLIEAGLPSTKQ